MLKKQMTLIVIQSKVQGNDTVRELNTVVRGNAQAIMRGTVFEVDQKDDQLIQITATWHRERAETIQNDIAPYFN